VWYQELIHENVGGSGHTLAYIINLGATRKWSATGHGNWPPARKVVPGGHCMRIWLGCRAGHGKAEKFMLLLGNYSLTL